LDLLESALLLLLVLLLLLAVSFFTDFLTATTEKGEAALVGIGATRSDIFPLPPADGDALALADALAEEEGEEGEGDLGGGGVATAPTGICFEFPTFN